MRRRRCSTSSRCSCAGIMAIAPTGRGPLPAGTLPACSSPRLARMLQVMLVVGCSALGGALDPYPTCADDLACNPECNDLCRSRVDATQSSPNCWGIESWQCGPFNPEAVRNQPSCTYAWYRTGEIWGAEQFSIIDANREKTFCTNVCPYGYYILSPNLADGELPLLSAAELQDIIIAAQGVRRHLSEEAGVEQVAEGESAVVFGGHPDDASESTDSWGRVRTVEAVPSQGRQLEDLAVALSQTALTRALRLADSLRRWPLPARRALGNEGTCDLETVNKCGQDYLATSTAEKLADCQTLWDLFYCIDGLNCGSEYDETQAETTDLIWNVGCGNYSYQPRDACDEETAQACIDALDAETCTGISVFRKCMEASGCITEDAFDSDFAGLMATLDELDDQCEFECRACDTGCRSTLWCLDYYGCAKCNSSASLWVSDGAPYKCLKDCPSGYADSAGVCTLCIGVVEDGVCTQLSAAARPPAAGRGSPVGWEAVAAAAAAMAVFGAGRAGGGP